MKCGEGSGRQVNGSFIPLSTQGAIGTCGCQWSWIWLRPMAPHRACGVVSCHAEALFISAGHLGITWTSVLTHQQGMGKHLQLEVKTPMECSRAELCLGSSDVMRLGTRSSPFRGPRLILVRTKYLYGHKLPLCRLTGVGKAVEPAESLGHVIHLKCV